MFDVLLIYKILRHFVSQNDSVVFTETGFVCSLRQGKCSACFSFIKREFLAENLVSNN